MASSCISRVNDVAVNIPVHERKDEQRVCVNVNSVGERTSAICSRIPQSGVMCMSGVCVERKRDEEARLLGKRLGVFGGKSKEVHFATFERKHGRKYFIGSFLSMSAFYFFVITIPVQLTYAFGAPRSCVRSGC